MIKFEDLKIVKPEEKFSKVFYNDVEITVKHKRPVNELMMMTSYVLSEAEDPKMSYFHPVRFNVIFTNAIIEFYTDIEIPEDMTFDVIYDLVKCDGLYELITAEIEDDIDYIFKLISQTAKEIYSYRSSLVGIMEKITSDYGALSLDAEQIRQNLDNPEGIELLRNIMDRFG
jgi:hypothetical protein